MTNLMRSKADIPPIKYNLSRDFKWSRLRESKNRVCREQNLVSNHENKMDNR